MSSRGTTPRSRRTSTQGKGIDVASEAEEGEVIRKMLGPQEVLTGAQFYEFLRDTQAAMKQSLALQKSLIDKCRELKLQLVEKSTKLQWAYRMKMEDEQTIKELRDAVNKATGETAEVREKEANAQELIKQLTGEVHKLEDQVAALQKAMLNSDLQPQSTAGMTQSVSFGDDLDTSLYREDTLRDETPFMRWKRMNDIWMNPDPSVTKAHHGSRAHDESYSRKNSRLARSGSQPLTSPIPTSSNIQRASMPSTNGASRLWSRPVHDDLSHPLGLGRDPELSRVMSDHGADRVGAKRSGKLPRSRPPESNQIVREAGQGLTVGGLGVGFGYTWEDKSSITAKPALMERYGHFDHLAVDPIDTSPGKKAAPRFPVLRHG